MEGKLARRSLSREFSGREFGGFYSVMSLFVYTRLVSEPA